MITDSFTENIASERYRARVMEAGRYERQLTALNTITTVLNRSTDLNRALNITLSETEGALGLPFSAIWLWDNTKKRLRPRTYHGLPDSLVQEISDSDAELGALAVKADYDQAVILKELLGLLRHHGEHYRLSHVLNIPLMAQQHLVGVLSFFAYDASGFNGEVRVYLGTIANLLGTAIYNTGWLEQVQNDAHNLEAEVAARTYALTAANEKLKVARDLATEASRAKSAFLANMSHELRTPLNAILGYSELLQDEAAEVQPDFIGPLQKINTAGKNLLHLITDILDLSKIEAGKMQLHPETFKVANLVEEVVNSAASLIQKNSNKVEVLYGDNLGSMYADPGKVRQIVYNLLSNACKFTDKGFIMLEATRPQIDGSEWIELSVTDSGIGINQEQLKKLFKEFTQADASSTRKYAGTGLGLVLSHRFSEIMGGNISVESEPGKGSKFTVRLPAKASSGDASPFLDDHEISPFLDDEE